MGTYGDVREKTRYNIASAFWELYCEKDLNKITIKEITDRAGYNRATFYVYFENIRSVLDYVEEQIYDYMKAHSDPGLHMTAEEALHEAVVGLDKSRHYLRVLLSDRGDPKFICSFRSYFRSVITQIVQNGDLLTTVPLDFALDFSIGGLIHCLQKWYEVNPELSTEELVKNIITVAFSGIFRLPSGSLIKESDVL